MLEDLNSDDLVWVGRSPADGDDLVLRFGGQDRVILTDTLSGASTGIETIVFADGTTWNVAAMRAAAMSFAGTDAAETLRGFDGADLLVGGRGDDWLVGGEGNDTYRFSQGDGHDTIEDGGTSAFDRLEITDMLSSEATVDRLYKGSDAIVISFAWSDDTITIRDALSEAGEGVETIVFADGVTWTRSTILELLDNNAPVAVADGIFTVKMEEALLIDPASLLRNDYDSNGDEISIIAVDGGEHGTAQIDGNGNIVFTGAEGFTGATQITYTISDGRNGLSTATVDIRVTPPASAKDDTGFSVVEDGYLTIETLRLLSNDVDGDRMIVSQVFDATNGTVSLSSNGQISFTPAANFNGLASFSYVANTPEGGRAEATVYIDVLAANDAPVAGDDGTFTTDEDVAFEIDPASLLADDTDIDGDALTVVGVIGNDTLQVQLTDDGVIVVTPAPYFFGSASFQYVVSDPSGATDTATVTVYVNPVNNDPEPQPDTLTTAEDTPILTAAADLLANDIEHDGEPLTIVSVRRGTGGSVQLNDNQTVLFTPSANFNGQAHYFYTVDDGQGGLVETRVDIDVTPVNDAPNARDESYSTAGKEFLHGTEDVPLVISITDLLANDSDVDGLTLTLETISFADNGTAVIVGDGTILFTPDQDYWGTATFRYVVSDEGGLVDDATVTLYFDPVGDAPPEAANDTITVYEDVPYVIPVEALLANDTDIDRDVLEIVSVSMGFGAHGTVAFNEDGDIVFTPALNATQGSSFRYTVTDNADGEDTATVTIVIIPVNDSPTAGNDTGQTTLDAPLILRISDLMANDSDVDLDPDDYDLLQFVGIAGTSAGTASIYNDEFVVIEFDPGYSGDVTATYTIADPEGVEDDGTVYAVISDTRAEVLTGTAIRDLIIGTAEAERIEGLAGDDDLFGRGGDDVLAGGDGADRLDGGEGYDTADYTGSNIGVRADLEARIGQGGHAQGDVFFGIEALIGTAFADELSGDGEDNRLQGMGGADMLSGRDGDDTLEGGAGNDTLDGGLGADLLDGGEGSDTADYFSSTEAVQVSLADGTATGGDATGDTLLSIENLIGSDFDDALTGDDADNRLQGGRGDDILIGGAGNDMLIGGRGADQLVGGDGIDTADYSISAEGVIINMADAAAGGGDAEGDTFSSIELVIASFHDDTIIGDDLDNVIRGGRGADIIDGGAGFDTADYSTADEGVTVNLATGLGTAGEAAGDQLSGIEKLVGSAYADTFTGSAADETFDGGFDNDIMAGGAGSDSYLFGFDAGEDLINEVGDATDTDRILLGADVRVADLSVIRDGDDLLLELEHDDGLLIDTVRVSDHFLGAETGVEEIVFADGTVWDRDAIDFLQRNGRFNAVDDIIRFADEDVSLVITPDRLILNDAEEDADLLTIVGVENAVNGTVTLLDDGSVLFTGAQDYNGDAFFDYIVRDQHGRESRATVEVDVLAVNDAPVAADDGVFIGIEDEVLVIPFADLFANDIDVDGDTLTVVAVGPLLDDDGNPLYQSIPGGASNGLATIVGNTIHFDPNANHYGFAGFTYTVSDPSGETSTASVELNFVGVNDAPTAAEDKVTARLGATRTIFVRDLLANDSDVEGDAFSFTGFHDAFNGTATLRTIIENGVEVQVIDFDADALGDAGFSYDVVDVHGASSTGFVDINVIPLNDPPTARNDSGFETLEDAPIIIDPSVLLANDSDPNGDPLEIISLERFPLNGSVAFNEDGMIVFTPRADYNGAAGFTYTISDGQGGTDTAFVSIDVLLDNDAPIVNDDVLAGLEDIPIVVLAAEAFANDMEPDGDVIFFEAANFLGILTDDFSNRSEHAEGFALDSLLLDSASASAALADGSALPDWLSFDAATLTFTGTPPEGTVDAFDVTLTFSDVDPATGDPVSFEASLTIDPTGTDALAAGVTYDPGFAALDLGAGSWSAALPSGRPLPGWLSFNAETMTLERTGIEPDADESIARVRLAFTPEDGGDGFAIEVRIDPTQPIDPAINALLANPAYFAANGLFALSVADDAAITASKATGTDLPDWLSFDAGTLTFTGTPPAEYVGTIPVRIDVGASAEAGTPAYAIIRDIVIDESYHLSGASGFTVVVTDEHIYVTTPEDFYGAFAIQYTARDTKDAVSADPATIVINVEAQRELPDPAADTVTTVEDVAVTFSLADLLANDVDDDGDPIRVVAIGDVASGTLKVDIPELSQDLPAVDGLAGPATHSALLADGSELPDWLSIDAETGRLFGTPPLDALETLAIVVTSTDGATTVETQVSLAVDGNAGVTLTYTPVPQASGSVTFDYTVTDDAEGTASAQVTIEIAPDNDPPVAHDDTVAALEDTVLEIPLADLLANDTDIDGDPLEILAALNAVNGTVELVDGVIRFTPNHNFDGVAGFDYVVTDNADGADTGHVTVNVASTNQAPQAVVDVFAGTEDTALVIDIADLLANDIDPDGDTITFLALTQQGEGGQAFLLPGDRISLVPRDNITGEVTFTYQITDGRLNSTQTATIVVNFAPVNDAPDVVGESGYETGEDTTLAIDLADLLANDSDVEGDPLNIVSVLDPVNGSVEMVGGQAVFTPRADYFGNAGFSYEVSDGNGGVSTGFVSITVTPEGDLPIAVPDTGFTMSEDGSITIDPADLIANDVDPDGDTITFVRAFGNGVEELPDGTIRFTPPADAYGAFTLSYVITDGSGVEVTGTFTVNVLAVDDDPDAGDDTVAGTEDQPLVIAISSLTANDSDADGHAVAITGLANAVGGTVAFDGLGNIVFTPDADRVADASFDYVLTDATGATDVATVTVTLQPVNDAPVIAPIAQLTGTEDTYFSGQLPAAAFSDIDGDALAIEVRLANGDPLPDWLVYYPDARGLAGTPPADFAGTIELLVTASDGAAQASRVVELLIEGVNDAPVAADDTIEGGQAEVIVIAIEALLANDSDVDGDALDIIDVTAGPGATAELDGAGNIVVTRDPAASGDLEISYTVSDGTLTDTASVTISVDPVNEAPVIAALDDLHADEDTAIDFSLPEEAFSDPDGDALTLTATRAGGTPLPSWLSFDPDTRRFTGTPPANFFGTIAIAVTASDGALATTATFDLVIDPVNDAPQITGPFSDRFVTEDQPFDIQLQQGLFTDVDGDALTYTITLADGTALPDWMTADTEHLRLAGVPPADFAGTISIRITASDGQATASDVFAFTVTGTNDAPVLDAPLSDTVTDDAGDALQTGVAFTITIPDDAFSDPDGDTLTYTARLADGSDLPDWMSFDGLQLSGTAPSDALGDWDIEIIASDGSLQNSDVFTISFGEGSSAPIAVDDGIVTVYQPFAVQIDASALLANDVDPDGDTLTVVAVGQGAHGSVTLEDGVITYDAVTGYAGEDQFTYTISDGEHTATASVHLEVDDTYADYDAGTDGDDTMFGGLTGSVFGGAGNDTLIGGLFGGNLAGGTGDDVLIGLLGAGTFDGNEGNDTIIGGLGSDTITGGTGDDDLTGGLGNDTFIFREGDGSDTINDFSAGRSIRNFYIAGDELAIQIGGINDYDDLMAHARQGEDGVVFDFGNGDEIFLRGTQLAALDENSFTFF